MDHEAIRAELPSLVAGHLPRNVRKFKFRIYDDKPPVSALGFLVDPEPFEGTVTEITETAIVVKIARAVFGVVDRRLASQIPLVGAEVRVTPYARHHFDGTRVDAPTEEIRHSADGHAYAVRSVILGGATTTLPVSKPHCATGGSHRTNRADASARWISAHRSFAGRCGCTRLHMRRS